MGGGQDWGGDVQSVVCCFEMASWRLVRSAPDWGTLALAFIISGHQIFRRRLIA